MSTRIRTTCTVCGSGLEAPAGRVLVDLPAAPDTGLPPQLLLHCPVCDQGSATAISWAHAAYLLAGGAGCLTSPDVAAVRPVYPELPPSPDRPLTLDDLLELHEELEHGLLTR